MSGYVRDIVIKKHWQGDDVTIVMRQAKFGDLLGVTQYLKDGKVQIPISEFDALLAKMKPYTKALDGLKAHDASCVTIDELYESAYFLDLLTDVMTEWLSKATPANPPSPGASLNG